MDFSTYFDWAATAPIDADLFDAAREICRDAWANPSSAHDAGARARKTLEEARRRCACALGVRAEQIVFTSGGTESDAWPILSLLQSPFSEKRGSIVVSAVEHPAVREQAAAMRHCGFDIIAVQPDKNGIVSADAVMRKMRSDTALVCVQAVNNETGAVQKFSEIAAALKKSPFKKAKFHVDAVQAVGKIPLDLSQDGIDFAAISGHKIRAIRGIGILFLRQRREGFLRGGGQEFGLRSGTENVFGAVNLALCLEKYGSAAVGGKLENAKNADFRRDFERQCEATNCFCHALAEKCGAKILPQSRLDAEFAATNFSPFIVQAAFERIPGNVMVRALSAAGFSISTGSACSTTKNSRPVLQAMGVSADDAQNSVRFSFGCQHDEAAIQSLLAAVKAVVERF